ncbi:MAG: recombinase family protein [Vicinamibacterales bacterium]
MISKAATNGKVKAQRADEVRCALYTRQSVTDAKEEFSSLDAQREAAEAYVLSQRARGWRALPDRYDDAGISGATADRPALKRLLDDVEAGRVDCIVVYKIDRLSRSIADFVQLMDRFDKKGVAFAAVTQQFDTSTSVGRLTLNLLSCFAQYEREVIAERTRDKVHAARRRGRWTGGPPPLGYDVAPEGGRIVVNEVEAKRVRQIFALHAEHETVTRTVEALNARGWTTKAWTTREGRERPGGPWTKHTLGKLLANPTYIGRVGLQGEDFEGEHQGIVDPAVFARAQELLAQRTHKPGKRRGGRRGTALLSGLLRCAPCDAAMGMTWTRRGARVHRYYLCRRTQKDGWRACPHPSVPAHDIESLVVGQIRAVGRDAALQAHVLDAVREQGAEVDPADLRRALTLFEPVWDVLHAEEQARVMRLLVEGISYDGAAGTAVVAFRATGIQGLAEELAP